MTAAEETATSFTGTVTYGGTAGITGTSAAFVDGVLTIVTITPQNIGNGVSFTVVDDESHTGSTTFNVRNLFDSWSGNGEGNGTITFEEDANNDGVAEGLAWLLGATTPSENASTRLPLAGENTGDLVVDFDCLKSSQHGTATLHFEYSNNLALGSWTSIVVPESSNTVNGVLFTVTPIPDSDMNQIQATVPASQANGEGKMFGRLRGNMP